MAGRQHRGAEIARRFKKVAEFYRLIAFHAGHRRLAGDIAVGEFLDHRLAKAGFVVENVMGNPEGSGDARGVVDILPGAAGALAAGRLAVIVELQRDADHVVALLDHEAGGGGTVDAARHGDDHPRAGGKPVHKLAPHHVARRRRQADGEAVELLGHHDLAAEARGVGEAEGEVEHVLLVLAGILEHFEPFGIDDDVAGRAGERALASALDIDVVAMRDLQHREADRRLDFLPRAAEAGTALLDQPVR